MNLWRKLSNHLVWWLRDIFINAIAASVLVPMPIRYIVYRLYGIRTQTMLISPRCFFGRPQITIGKNSFVNYGCYFDTSAPIEIGQGCAIGPEVMFCSTSHEIGSQTRRAGTSVYAPIKVEDGVWIGTRATILPGVIIGRGVVIAAGSVVTKNCEPNCLYAGVPARKVRELD